MSENGSFDAKVARAIVLMVLLGAVLMLAALTGLQAICSHWNDLMMCGDEKKLPWAVLSGLAAAPAALLIWYWRTTHKKADIENARATQLTSRFPVAVEMLAKSNVWTLGGIYALDRLARDSPGDCPTVFEVLAAYVRVTSPEQAQLTGGALRIMASHLCAAIAVLSRLPRPEDARIDLYGAMLCGLRLTNLNLARTDLLHADLSGADLRATNLFDADLRSADLSHADLTAAICSKAALSTATLSDAILLSAELEDANLKRADLSRAMLSAAKLSRADLTGATLIEADLTDVNLLSARLNGADLSGACLQGASIGMADLINANLSNTDLSRADLTGSKITSGQVRMARNYSPEHLDTARKYEESLAGQKT